jgi:hypothetical protein
MNWPKPATLRGRHATLEPLTREHCEALDPYGKIPEFKYCAVSVEPALSNPTR